MPPLDDQARPSGGLGAGGGLMAEPLPFGLLHPAGDGLDACLYCRCYRSGFCQRHQGDIPRRKMAAVKCIDWEHLPIA